MDKNTSLAQQLSAVNHKIVAEGQVLPIVTLKDGTMIPTGTVGAMLHNIIRYNEGERGEVVQDLKLAIPALASFGLFELFTPEEWILGDNPGRCFVGHLAQAYIEQGTVEGFKG
ncbi:MULTISPECIES: hypothetical protein [Vibrio]|uniref:DUF7709 family protein n=1 Tax=Vibrio TaxID=662 RepID=UPI001268F03C|nr:MULTISPECIES: hypothetical protein [Vibrio]NRF62304.1 hypothetical protein [Vibrio coralliilyticus]QFT36598.1 hypothetical protein FIU99_09140 [Vibrio sp. THAF64]QGM34499.1 hypothetical protein GGC04_09155 [Vibrio sp. THAF191d]QGN70001.1 hypothetical protein GGC03_09160 [Vibrio sp. THAF191c]